MRKTVTSDKFPVTDLRPYTWAYLRCLQMRCKCCGEFMGAIQATFGDPKLSELCLSCQIKLAPVMEEVEAARAVATASSRLTQRQDAAATLGGAAW